MGKIKTSTFFIFIAFSSWLVANEPSVYGAGDLNSLSPYGLSANEQFMLDTKREVIALRSIVNEQQNRIDGLISLIESLNVQVAQLKEDNHAKVDTNQLKADILNEVQLKEDKAYKLMLDLGSTIDKIDKEYVSTVQMNEALKQLKSKTQIASQALSDKESYLKAQELFNAKRYGEAKSLFESSLSKNYNTAGSNYYLGEIAYLNGAYVDALGYYKLSASLDDKAKYLDNLYLHTAIALENSGDKNNAKAFYTMVIKKYSKSNLAKIAQERLKKL